MLRRNGPTGSFSLMTTVIGIGRLHARRGGPTGGKDRRVAAACRSSVATTSAASSLLPSWNVTPSRRVKRQVRSSTCSHFVARRPTGFPSWNSISGS